MSADLPGIPLASGFTPLSPERRADHDRSEAEIRGRMASFIASERRTRLAAMASAHNYVLGAAVDTEGDPK